jgi:hypothetical protein
MAIAWLPAYAPPLVCASLVAWHLRRRYCYRLAPAMVLGLVTRSQSGWFLSHVVREGR